MKQAKFRKRLFEFTPQLDVELPVVHLKEDVCNFPSHGAVYDLKIRSQHDFEDYKTTTLTIEELIILQHMIDHFIKMREEDPRRQNPNLPLV